MRINARNPTYNSISEMLHSTAKTQDEKNFAVEFDTMLEMTKNIKKLVVERIVKGISEEKMSELVGCDLNTIYDIESSLDEDIPSYILEKYSAILNIDLE